MVPPDFNHPFNSHLTFPSCPYLIKTHRIEVAGVFDPYMILYKNSYSNLNWNPF
ncbi:hypothetical protein HanXRQr2_Chr05g0197721 [Helianthus annuus]|uniref:Uncharacterized protein n=1 Tax=Helianthus annuus TaxID=4232 RepID=A0A9K3IWX4_HELAN|nr:hypothetical protein HanXRQr2_Chr05g0197721 [Helianthus annuus]KAJ0569112.1 hypothetical protein HanHA300_Chr05g0162351 [Helianthus annuus]KAJ0583405.1 hypothetical protein HanHA89_Chr05g0176201 [Helianthus annuus]KAJ0746142.1 hypothetical protein HanOQP8_Chr05g0174161 [Helianthus annuus]KAJ0749144.1 hypothetical protein HanLR1_Chr05g0166431 [Helianthus annuus]